MTNPGSTARSSVPRHPAPRRTELHHRVAGAILVLLVGGVPAAAQRGSEFAARVRTATTAADPLALQALAREPVDFAARVDAIAAAEPLAPWQRARAIDTLLPAAERQRLLATLWIAEPSARRSRAPVFANLGAAWMIERYAKAEAGERHDLRTVVNFPPVGLHADLRAAIRGSGDRAAVRDAAVALLRASTVHRAAHRDEAIEALRAVDDARARERVRGAFGQTVVTRVPPERLASLLPSRDLRVVARAVFVLRRVLGLPDRPEVLAALADDPEPSLARHGAGTWTQARIERELPTLGRGTRSPLFCALSEGKAVPSPTNLARIRARLIRVGLKAADENQGRAVLALAARSGAIRALFDAAFAVPDPTAAVHRAASAVVAIPAGTTDLKALEPVTIRLLDHADPGVRARGVELAVRLLQAGAAARLRAPVLRMAQAALRDPHAALAHQPIRFGCGTGPQMVVVPEADAGGLTVQAAARLGDSSLVPALLATLAKSGDPLRQSFLLACLAELAPHVDGPTALRLRTTAVGFAPKGWDGRLQLPRPAPHQVSARRLLLRLFASLPDAELPFYATLLGDASGRAALVHALSDVQWTAARAERVLQEIEPRNWPHTVAAAAPRMLARACANTATRDGALQTLAQCLYYFPTRTLGQLHRGELPRTAVAAALTRLSAFRDELAPLASSLAGPDLDPAHGSALAALVARAPACSAAALAHLAASPIPEVAAAAARRSGDAERIRATLDRLAGARAPEVAALALELAVDTGLSTPRVDAAARRLDAGVNPHGVVRAAYALAFHRAKPDELRLDPTASLDAIAKSRTAIEAKALDAAVLRAGGIEQVTRLGDSAHAATLRAALGLASGVAIWPESLERWVLGLTTHSAATVRAAAYTALRTRDAQIWPCALLLHEARFDPDPAIRALAKR